MSLTSKVCFKCWFSGIFSTGFRSTPRVFLLLLTSKVCFRPAELRHNVLMLNYIHTGYKHYPSYIVFGGQVDVNSYTYKLVKMCFMT